MIELEESTKNFLKVVAKGCGCDYQSCYSCILFHFRNTGKCEEKAKELLKMIYKYNKKQEKKNKEVVK